MRLCKISSFGEYVEGLCERLGVFYVLVLDERCGVDVIVFRDDWFLFGRFSCFN